MSTGTSTELKRGPLYIQVLVIAALVLVLDLVLAGKSDASIMVGLLFWGGIGQGIVAMTAAADLSKGKWIDSIRPYMQQYYPLLLLVPLAFLVYSRHLTVYGWAHSHPNAWLDGTFFIVRNVFFGLLPFVLAHFYVKSAEKDSPKRGLLAVLYILSFIVSQSFMAYDQVMTFEYPFINTLFGPYFFVEALYAGIGFCAVMAGIFMLKNREKFQAAYKDFVLMIIGFALFWAGLFYSQYLVIWYGNIPEEVAFFSRRLMVPALKNMGLYMLITIFLLPFIALVSRKVKNSVPMISVIVLLLFSGLVVERLVLLIPVAHISPLATAVHFILLGIPFIYLLMTQYKSVKHAARDL